jgi:hypothetical protein
MTYLITADASTSQGLTDDQCAKFRRGEILESASKFTYRCPHTTDYDYISLSLTLHFLFREFHALAECVCETRITYLNSSVRHRLRV